MDQQFGIHPLKTLPDELRNLLFEQPSPLKAEVELYGGTDAVPLLKTYAVLDAAKMPYEFLGHLENSDLQYKSLFQGESQERLQEHAPYLVELEGEHDFTRKLFTTEKAMGFWEKELGIYIRSRAGFDEVRRHLRKFIRVQDENGKWNYLRFWEPTIGAELLVLEEMEVSREFLKVFSPTHHILSFVVFCTRSFVRSVLIQEASKINTGPLRLNPLARKALRKAKIRADLKQLVYSVIQGQSVTHHIDQRALLERAIEYHDIGFRERRHFSALLTWEVLLGPDFLKKYANGVIEEILLRSQTASEAFECLRAFLKEQN